MGTVKTPRFGQDKVSMAIPYSIKHGMKPKSLVPDQDTQTDFKPRIQKNIQVTNLVGMTEERWNQIKLQKSKEREQNKKREQNMMNSKMQHLKPEKAPEIKRPARTITDLELG
jgi:hypothetical protein